MERGGEEGHCEDPERSGDEAIPQIYSKTNGIASLPLAMKRIPGGLSGSSLSTISEDLILSVSSSL